MATRIHWPRYGWRLWGAAVLLAALAAALAWGPPWGVGRWVQVVGFPLWVWFNLHRWLEPPLLACGGGVLAVARPGETLCVPLATAEVRRTHGHWTLRWPGERRGFRALLRRSPGVDALVEEAQATAQALSAQGQALPRTAQEAERVLNVGAVALPGRLYLGLTLGFIGVAAAAVGLQQPFLLLATVPGPILLAWGHRRAVWAPDGLWLVRPGGQAEPIPPHQVVAVEAGAPEVAVHTRHPGAPVIRLAAADPVGLLLRLRDWAGLPPAAPAHPS